jgi:hypothetical protein
MDEVGVFTHPNHTPRAEVWGGHRLRGVKPLGVGGLGGWGGDSLWG